MPPEEELCVLYLDSDDMCSHMAGDNVGAAGPGGILLAGDGHPALDPGGGRVQDRVQKQLDAAVLLVLLPGACLCINPSHNFRPPAFLPD